MHSDEPDILDPQPERTAGIAVRHRCKIVVGLFVVHVAMVSYEAYRDAPVYDEVAHLAAGVSHWKLQHFSLYRANPPLPRMIAAIPVIASDPVYDWSHVSHTSGTRCEFRVGKDFVDANGVDSFFLYSLGRWSLLPFTIAGGLTCYAWSRRLFGEAAGLLSLTLWSFSPNIIANAHWITPDLPATSMGLIACYAFWRWLQCPPDGIRAFATGIALGMALLTKTTWILLFGLWPLLWLLSLPRINTKRDSMLQLALIFVTGVFTLNVGYAFHGSFQPLDEYEFISESLAGTSKGADGLGNRFRGTLLGTLPVPLPADFVLGIDVTKRVFERKIPSYLRMTLQEGGWWYYYLYGLLVKTPVGLQVLCVVGAIVLLRNKDILIDRRDTLCLVVTPVALLIFVSSNIGINRHIRYVLPVLPYLFILAGAGIAASNRTITVKTVIIVCALIWGIISSLAVFPYSGSYFNEISGGPVDGWKHLSSSNVDWGQDLIRLREWKEQHPEIQSIGLAYYGSFDPKSIGLDYTLPPTGPVEPRHQYPDEVYGPQPGVYAISVHLLTGSPAYVPNGRGGTKSLGPKRYVYFRHFAPSEVVGTTIHIYDLSVNEVNRVRSLLGLSPHSFREPER